MGKRSSEPPAEGEGRAGPVPAASRRRGGATEGGRERAGGGRLRGRLPAFWRSSAGGGAEWSGKAAVGA